jgi:hypothetical protein
VRIDRAGGLPDRCVICNRPAEGRRVKRTLYWSPKAWRIGTAAVLVGFAAIGGAIAPYVLYAFWPLVLVLIIANLFVRKSLKLEIGICRRHALRRNALRGLSIASMVLLAASFFLLQVERSTAYLLLVASTIGVLALAIVQALVGIQAMRLSELSADHAWLSGTGAPFREALPELS